MNHTSSSRKLSPRSPSRHSKSPQRRPLGAVLGESAFQVNGRSTMNRSRSPPPDILTRRRFIDNYIGQADGGRRAMSPSRRSVKKMEAEHGRLKLWLDGAAGKPSLSLPPETSEADVKPPQTSRNGEAANRMRGRENSGLGWERGREQHNWRETGGSWTNEKEKEWTKAVRALAHGPKDASKIVRRISLSPSPRAKKPPSPSAQRFSIATSGQEISRRRSVSPTRPFAPADSITSQRHSREFSPSPTGKRTVLSLVTSLRGRSSQRKSPSSPQAPVSSAICLRARYPVPGSDKSIHLNQDLLPLQAPSSLSLRTSFAPSLRPSAPSRVTSQSPSRRSRSGIDTESKTALIRLYDATHART